jgi:aryl-alcohol dehydrogenase-like predicted oxidoreductase
VGFFKHVEISKECQFFTKWVPQPEPMTRKNVEAAVGRSLERMGTGRLDMLQFHWYLLIAQYVRVK